MLKYILTREEYFQWISYFSNKPPDAHEIQMAMLINVVTKGLGAKNTSMEDFIISKTSHKPKKRGQSPDAIAQALALL